MIQIDSRSCAPGDVFVALAGEHTDGHDHAADAHRAGAVAVFLVLEMGSRGVGHIARLTDLARPVIGVVLNIGSAHLGEFGSTEAVAMAKSELVAAPPSAAEDGVAILNADDQASRYLAGRTAAAVWRFGTGPDVDVRYHDVDVSAGGRPRFQLSAGGQDVEVRLGLVGAHQAANAAAASAVALASLARNQPPARVEAVTEQRLTDIGRTLAEALPRSRWRMELTDRPGRGEHPQRRLQRNPESMRAAVDGLIGIAAGTRRTWAVLGAMGELGERAEAEHASVGEMVRKRGVHRLVAVGADAVGIYAGAAGDPAEVEGFIHVPDMGAALDVLRSQLRPGDVVLVKGSRYVGLERLALALLEETEIT